MPMLAILTTGPTAVAAIACPLPKQRFFANLDISITSVFGGGADIWNVSSLWAYDGKTQRQRTDTQALVRELSSGASYERFVYESVTVNGSSYAVGAKGACTVSPAEDAFPADACVGSVARWMPADETRDWKGQGFQPDTFIGYQLVDGVNASTWGWTYRANGNPHAPIYSRHRVYLAAAGGRIPAGTPLLEEQTIDELSGYTTKATITYRTFEDAYGGASAIFDQPWAGAFTPCTPALRMATTEPLEPKTAATCACHGPTWIEIDDGASGVGGHCYDKLCIENKEAHWQYPLSDCARVGGQKPFCPVVEPPAGNSSHAFCCTSCAAGGCSAFYSPKDVGYPYACSKGETIVPIPGHGQTCR